MIHIARMRCILGEPLSFFDKVGHSGTPPCEDNTIRDSKDEQVEDVLEDFRMV